ncbi:OmpA family protein [Neolewinella lacunae]|uniref:OmpA family protein n=1 Tax=Neolewinella lacunae TaxID=1517758 RepID=A0A923PLS2_9BACT|nr:OmpA family protein [Neolewinella lacunae]MBC6994775.1 OmpA family protein [Neolewinella lacunae]MDN3634397.1 OmpA family protein [Neolewinella lacunae]
MARLTTFSKLLITLLIVGVIAYFLYQFAPGIKVEESRQLESIEVTDSDVNNVTDAAQIPLPGEARSQKVASQPLARIAAYAWNAQSGIIAANGGPFTTEGSVMESNNVNLEIIRQDWLSELRNLQMKFIQEFDAGKAHPEEGVFAIMMMGDGAPYYISSVQQAIDDKYGPGKYHVQVIGAVGLSYGEDKLIGPPKWKLDPQSMRGALISTVIGDGDWVTSVNYAFANGIPVNPDPSTYDPNAVNFYPSANDDYIESAKELIKSQREGWTIPLKEIVDGKLTGNTINKAIDGCATWTPGDKMVFDALTGFTDIVSTKEFNNQMATTLIAVKEWCERNPAMVSNILKSSFTSSNQLKLYDSWRQRAAEAVTATYQMEDAAYWKAMFQGQKGEKGGISYNMGGSRVFNLADARQYYGLTDGVNRYQAVYDQVSYYLKELNPAGFNQNVKRIVPYAEAVNLSFLSNVKDIDAGAAYTTDYTQKARSVLASGEWKINFASGRATLAPGAKDVLDQIYNLLIQAEDAKLEMVGHTDSEGDADANFVLSQSRAEAVKTYMIQRGIPANRFQKVEGKGETEPVADNATATGRAQNRRVVINLLN